MLHSFLYLKHLASLAVSNMQIQTMESISSGASKTSLIGAGSSVVAAASNFDVGVWAGIAIGLVGLVINFYFKWKADKRAERAAEVWHAKQAAKTDLMPLYHEPEDQ